MSNVNYSLKHKVVRLIDSRKAWLIGKNGNKKFNPKHHIIGKIEMTMQNMIITASNKQKPKFKGNTYNLNLGEKNKKSPLNRVGSPYYFKGQDFRPYRLYYMLKIVKVNVLSKNNFKRAKAHFSQKRMPRYRLRFLLVYTKRQENFNPVFCGIIRPAFRRVLFGGTYRKAEF